MRAISDRPGRYFALLIMSPLLVLIGKRVRSSHPIDALVLTCVGVGLFVYELFWVTQTDSEIVRKV